MYACVNAWSFGGNMGPIACLEAAKQLGFAGFEPALEGEGPLSPHAFEKGARELRARADDLGMKIPSLASGLYWGSPYSAVDPAIRAKARDITRAQIDCAAALGAPAILVVPATVGKGFFGEGVGYRDAYARAKDALCELEPYAKAANVVIGVENVWNNFLLSPVEAAAFLDEIDSPFVRMYLDVGNLVPFGEGVDWIRTLGSRIACVHVKDFRRAVGTLAGFVPLLEGDVDFAAILPALREVGFDGALTAEVGTVKADPLHGARQAANALEIILILAPDKKPSK